jgi:rRNA maturation endonuclease Nob1
MIKKFKFFEAEIYVGTNKHYNTIKPVNVQVLDEPKIFDYICDDCFCEFTVNYQADECNICGSENIESLLI